MFWYQYIADNVEKALVAIKYYFFWMKDTGRKLKIIKKLEFKRVEPPVRTTL